MKRDTPGDTIDSRVRDAATPRGLVCPRCGCGHLPVAYTRHRPGAIVRCRACRHCGKRMITRERA